ncbi:MAG: hypothetical protein H3C38_07230 [Rhodospirillales bacterium]|nr:hypothetical protein [Rhodospirillales bacterium]
MKVYDPKFLAAEDDSIRIRPLSEQPSALAVLFMFFAVTVTLSLVGLYVAYDIHPNVLLRDPNATARQPEYYGLVSNLGILAWTSAAAISLYSGLLLRRSGGAPISRILLTGGAFTALLCLDDLFMLHEGLLARIGVSEVPLLVTYAVLAVLWVAVSVRRLMATEWMLLLIALAAMAGSVLIDLVNVPLPGQLLAEDMLKFTGILFWVAYFVRLSWQSMRWIALKAAE